MFAKKKFVFIVSTMIVVQSTTYNWFRIKKFFFCLNSLIPDISIKMLNLKVEILLGQC